jgi:uncharacterized membrane protein YsdA (DUF1294 family)
MSDETIECIKCGRDFIWAEGEQRFFREHHLNRPKLCQECRAQRNSERRPGMRDINTPFPAGTISVSTHQPKPKQIPQRGKMRRTTQPILRFGTVAMTIAVILSVFLILQSSLDPLAAWLIAINLTAFVIYGYDKFVARQGYARVPEKVLLALAAVGGTIGAFAGMQIFRHKTAKVEFRRWFWIIVALQITLVVGFYVLTRR